jgi:lipopolysaccharide transport system ATP-binding protein
MSDEVLRSEGLAKRYWIGGGQLPHATLRDLVGRMFRRTPNLASEDGPRREFWALNDISFAIRRGEVVGVLGRNGAGKSTLLKLLSRVTEPTRGEAWVRGRVGSLLEVGTGFHPELTGRENVYLNGAILGMRRTETAAKFQAIVAFAEMEKFIDTPVKYYSSGMYTRLAFSVAIHLEPEILIVDEVLAVGDAEFQQRCLDKMAEVRRSGRTILFVSHNMAAVSQLCTRTILLKGGRVERDGPTDEVADYYLRSSTTAGDESGRRELTTAPRAGGDGKVRFTAVELFGRSGLATRFAPGEPIRIRVRLRSEIADTAAEIGLSVRTLVSEVTVFTASSAESRAAIAIVPGEYEAELALEPNYLCPGSYAIQLGTTCGTLRDLVPEAIRFTIDDPRGANEFTRSLPGVVQLPYDWTALRPMPIP